MQGTEVRTGVQRLSLKEMLQVRERLGGGLLLLIIQYNERTVRIAGMPRLRDSSVRVSPEGDIYYPVFRERAWVNKPELYTSLSELPPGWSLERLLASRRRPISEICFHQVTKDGGSVKAAIRNMDHVLERYEGKGKEMAQILLVEERVARVREALQRTKWVPREEFVNGFTQIYRETLELIEKSGLKGARLGLKKDIERLLVGVSTGRDSIGNRNPLIMTTKLYALVRRVSYRKKEAEQIVEKFTRMKRALVEQEKQDRGILKETRHQLSTGWAAHEAFKFPDRGTTEAQQEILIGLIGTTIRHLEQVKVKPYKTTAIVLTERLREAQTAVQAGNYAAASKIFDDSLPVVTTTFAGNLVK